MPRTADALADMTDAQLLGLRFSDLHTAGLTTQGTWLQTALDQLHIELKQAGFKHFKPHAWLGTEWFAPDDVPGIAIPFYLAHPRLLALEKKQMLKAEGAGHSACMKLLRHEAGHALDAAYRLRRKKQFRELFGSFAAEYPDSYRPKPKSRDFVLHLDGWYAQAHPAEDFAETFAVWLTPKSRWQTRYLGWPAMAKLAWMDQTMQTLFDQTAPCRSRKQIEPIARVHTTLGEHYRKRRLLHMQDFPDVADADLLRVFSNDAEHQHQPSAAQFVRKHRKNARQRVAECTQAHPYVIDQVLQDTIDRCKELKLRLRHDAQRTETDLLLMLTTQTMLHLHHRPRPLAL